MKIFVTYDTDFVLFWFTDLWFPFFFLMDIYYGDLNNTQHITNLHFLIFSVFFRYCYVIVTLRFLWMILLLYIIRIVRVSWICYYYSILKFYDFIPKKLILSYLKLLVWKAFPLLLWNIFLRLLIYLLPICISYYV